MTIREIVKSLFTSREVQSLAEKILIIIKPLSEVNPAIAALCIGLENSLRELEKARKNGSYNTQTALVAEADEDRDLAFRAFRMYVEAAALRRNAPIAQAAKSLLTHIKKFDAELIYLGYAAQTAELNLFIAEMDRAKEYVDGSGATDWFVELKESQDNFVIVQEGKVDEEVEKSILVPTRIAKENTLQQLIALTSTLNGLEVAKIAGVAEANRKVDQAIEAVEVPARARSSRKKNSLEDSEEITE